MKTIGVIPARFGATRFMGKVLADLAGKPVLQHVWESASAARTLDDLIIATDDDRIMKAAKSFGAKAVFTSKDQPTGSDRLVEAVDTLEVDVVVNIQGDEPLVKPIMIDSLTRAITDEKNISMATLAKRITDREEIENPNVVKVVLDKNDFALYFSRSVIPFPRYGDNAVYYKHIGLYAYTKDLLFELTNLPKTVLEMTEGLEQLRALHNGYRIKVVETNIDTIGIDTPEDLERAKAVLGYSDAKVTRRDDSAPVGHEELAPDRRDESTEQAGQGESVAEPKKDAWQDSIEAELELEHGDGPA